MEVTLQLAQKEDAEEFVLLQDAAFLDDYIEFGVCPAYGRTAESLRRWILDKPNYKVMADGEIVGKISISISEENEGHIDCFCIKPSYQNQGVGQKAMRLLEMEHKEVTKWTLETPLQRERNLHFYKRCGYRIVGKMFDEIWLAVLEKEEQEYAGR